MDRVYLLGDRSDVVWGHGILAGLEVDRSKIPVLYTVDGDGRSERIDFSIPRAGFIWVRAIAPAPDRSLALIGSAYNDDGSGTAFVARVSPDRKATTVVRTISYAPSVVAVASDGNTWTVGDTFLDEIHDSSIPNVFKVFSPEGKLVRTFSVPVRAGGLRGDSVSGSVLTCSKERVVWMTNGNEYIEFSLAGHEIYRTDGPPLRDRSLRPWVRFAVSWDGQAAHVEADGTVKRIWLLSQSSGSWTPVNGGFADSALVVGFEGADLVTLEVNDHLERIFNRRTIGGVSK